MFVSKIPKSLVNLASLMANRVVEEGAVIFDIFFLYGSSVVAMVHSKRRRPQA